MFRNGVCFMPVDADFKMSERGGAIQTLLFYDGVCFMMVCVSLIGL